MDLPFRIRGKGNLLDLELGGFGRHVCSGAALRLRGDAGEAAPKSGIGQRVGLCRNLRYGRQPSALSCRPGDECPRALEAESGHGNQSRGCDSNRSIPSFLALGET